MAKLPWMQFYPADWVRDTVGLSANARAAWIDIICFLWDYKTRGQATRTSFRWASIVRLAPEEFNEVLAEFDEHEICDISVTGEGHHAEITLMSRRMMREQGDRDNERESNRMRKARQREKAACNADVTPESRTVTRKSQNQSHKSESESETELDRKTEKNKIPPVGEPAKVVKLKKLKVSLPDDFVLSDEMKAYAESKGMADPNGEFEHFTAHHKKNDSRFVDWAAAWQTWVLNAAKFGRKETHGKAQLPYGGFATKNYREGVF